MTVIDKTLEEVKLLYSEVVAKPSIIEAKASSSEPKTTNIKADTSNEIEEVTLEEITSAGKVGYMIF